MIQTTSAADLEDFFENGAIALHIVGPDGTILRANKSELTMLGYSPEEYVGRNITEFHADRPAIDDILRRLTCGQKLTRYPARLRAKDGSMRDVEITSSVQFKDGEFLNTRCFTSDITELRKAEANVRDKEIQLHQILNALPAAVYTTDEDGTITYFNSEAERLAGHKPKIGADHWSETWRLRDMNGKPIPRDECPMAVALRERRPVRGVQAFAERPDGSVVPFQPYPTPIFNAAGDLAGAVNMLVDITDQKERENHIEFVMHELSHRSKNLLTVVQSIATRTMKTSSDFEEFQAKFTARIAAMGRMHDLLVANRWAGADIEDVLRAELDVFLDIAKSNRISLSGEKIKLSPATAQNLSLAVHELATNATKYGALSKEGGHVEVTWLPGDSKSITFKWEEVADRDEGVPERKGFGMQLLEALFRNSRLDFSAKGLLFTGDLPHSTQ